jgi:hypothetical protein
VEHTTPTDAGEQPAQSPTEPRLRDLVVREPASYHPDRRIDWVHDPDLEQLQGQAGAGPSST